MSIDRRLTKLEDGHEAELDRLTNRFLDWLETLDKSTQYSVWRFVPTEGCAEAGVKESTLLWATCGRLQPDADDRTRAAEAWKQFPPRLLGEMEAAQPGSTSEMESWFLGA